jgi:potassium efflux system protein
MSTRLSVGLFCFCICLALVCGEAAWAAPPAPAVSAVAVGADTVSARLKEVEGSAQHDEKTKAILLDLYRKTLTSLEAIRTSTSATGEFKKAQETAGGAAKKLRAELEKREKTEKPIEYNFPETTPLTEIEQMLLKQKADYTAVDAKLTGFKDQLDQESGRPDQIRKRLTEARQQLETLNTEAKISPPPNQSALLTEAKRWYQQAQTQALNTEIKMLDQELLSQPMRLELLSVQRDTTARNLKRIRERIELLEARVTEQRRSDVEQARARVEEAGVSLAERHPVIQALVEKNIASSEYLAELSAKLEQVVSSDETIEEDAQRIEDEYRRAQKKLEVAGLSQALGRVLVEQRRQLPNVQRLQRNKRARERKIAATAFTQIQINEEITDLRAVETYIDGLTVSLTAEEVSEIRDDLAKLVEGRLELLNKSRNLGEAYVRALGELDYAETRLIAAVEKYDAFLAEHLLWIRSAPTPSIDILLKTPAQVVQFLSPITWFGVAEILLRQSLASATAIPVLVLIAILIFYQPRMKRLLLKSSKKILKPRTDRFIYTLKALGLTLLIALPWPLLFWLLGWLLSSAHDTDDFGRAFARSLITLAPAFFYLNAFRCLCLPDGLAEVHFRWPEQSTRALRQQITLLMTTFLPAVAIGITSSYQSTGDDGALARIAFLVVMASLSYFFYRLFGPKAPVLDIEFQQHPDSTLTRFRYLWLVLALILPFVLVVLSISGFGYTAATLTGSLIDTLWLILGLLVIHQLSVRWLLIIRRKLDFEAAVERRRAALAAAQHEAEEESSELAEIEEPEIDLKALNEESKKLLNSAIVIGAVIGLWFIWSDVLPAFGLLDAVTLWHYKGTIDGQDAMIPITLANILLSLIIIIITVVVSKRFPALLEIVLLKRVAFSSGGRYAATTMSRYVIAAFGALLALNTLGASWSQVQWLAAALSVGIGFGLQEIVANFISGIIILFERPIRVGDVVTVGEVDGTVTRIQIRATTIRTWDRQELLVPNKEFITGRLLNWTLSDTTTRIKVPVGVAYGSDVAKAMSIMRKVADEHPLVLSDPEPMLVFDAFGDNTLNLELRCFVGSLDYRLKTRTELLQTINEQFNQQGIVIAFPQRDVHLDTSQPLDVRIKPA